MSVCDFRPGLRPVELAEVLPMRRGLCYATVSEGQAWDTLLQAAYDMDFVILELDEDERPVRAYWRGEGGGS
jgi:hypothetical protein